MTYDSEDQSNGDTQTSMSNEMDWDPDALVDLVDIALVFAAISAATEVWGQYQTWRQGREEIQGRRDVLDGRALARMRRTLQSIVDRSEVAGRVLDDMAKKIGDALALIEPGDPALLHQISFVKGYKGRVRWRDRTRYRQLVTEVHWYLGDLVRLLDEISELVADFIPRQSNEELIAMTRVSQAEDEAIRQVLGALSDKDTSFGDAADMAMQLLDSARGYLAALTEEAIGENEAPSPLTAQAGLDVLVELRDEPGPSQSSPAT